VGVVHPELPRLHSVLLTGLTGACHLWDLPRVNCFTRVSLGLGAAGQFFVCLELFC
jgi:hypothetical protein